MFEHTNASRVWVGVNVSVSCELEVALMIETKLPLDPYDSDFDDESYSSLTAAAAAYLASSEHFDRAMVVPFNEPSDAQRVAHEGHHLAGWRFTVQESHFDDLKVNVIDVRNPDFHQAQEWAMRQFSPGSVVLGHFPLSEVMSHNGHSGGISRKWIPLRNMPGKATFISQYTGDLEDKTSSP